MVLWGGLRPILTRLLLDVASLIGLFYACYAPIRRPLNTFVLSGTVVLALATAGITNRWTLTLPMVPIVALQGIRRLLIVGFTDDEMYTSKSISFSSSRWIDRSIYTLSLFFLVLAAALIVLFPAVELPPIDGLYHVGIVDFHLVPVDPPSNSAIVGDKNDIISSSNSTSSISVRVLYPTLERPDPIPYLQPKTAVEFCRQTMKFGAPGPLKDWGWMLHTWRLSELRVKRNASLLPPSWSSSSETSQQSTVDRFPVIFFSHGLGGNAEIYSYQTMALAAHGHVVVSINHADGSAPVMQHHDGTLTLYDSQVVKLWRDGQKVDYVRLRRHRTDQRVREMLDAVQAFLQLDQHDSPDLVQRFNLSFRSRLKTDKVVFMGHSFGGATALTAAKRRPDLVQAVVAHEPAVDWMPDDARGSLFADRRLQGLSHRHNFTGGTGGFLDQNATSDDSLHQLDMLLLFSEEWRQLKWGFSDILEDLHREGRLGKPGSNFGVIDGAHHTEFSDTCMMTPVWLARSTGVTGTRNPLDTASEIEGITRNFLESVRRQS